MDSDCSDSGHQQPRRRKAEGVDHSNEGVYNELIRLRGLVDVIEGEKNKGSKSAACFPKLSLDNAMMSYIFGLVFMVIVSVTCYAFWNLYRAIYKRFFQEAEPF